MYDGKGDWTRVGYLNMTQPGAECPAGLSEHQYSNIKHEVHRRLYRSGAGL